jgi:hypothetical protein
LSHEIQEVRSILDELNSLCIEKDKENIVESRAMHVITGAINLIDYINENYDADEALELQRRLVNSIRGRDAKKFSRAITRIKESKDK